jgi:hypothetical protein
LIDYCIQEQDRKAIEDLIGEPEEGKKKKGKEKAPPKTFHLIRAPLNEIDT